MRARSLKMWFIVAIAPLLFISFAPAPVAQAASGFDYRGSVSIEAYYHVKDVVWKVDGIEYAVGKRFNFSVTADGFVISDGYIATDGSISPQGLEELQRNGRLDQLFTQRFARYLSEVEGYQPGSVQLEQALKSATPTGKPVFDWYAVTGVGLGEQTSEPKIVALGSNDPLHGYPAIFELKGLTAPAYEVRAEGSFKDKNLWPLSYRFKGVENKLSKRIERLVDKHGKDMKPYFQVLQADDLVPGTAVVNPTTPRQIRFMVGLGDYDRVESPKWTSGADAMYPMDAWISLARANDIPVKVVNETPSPTASPSATSSPTASATPSEATPVPTVSTEPVPRQDGGWWPVLYIVIAAIGGLAFVALGWFGILWLKRRRKQREASDEPDGDEE